MDYLKIAQSVPAEKAGPLYDQLTNFLLTSKNDEKMPPQLANSILMNMKMRGTTNNEDWVIRGGLASLLEAALLLEPEKTMAALGEMQLSSVAEQLKPM